jgi:dolichyl-phosphate-mannose--protein O-mannosyl transferase
VTSPAGILDRTGSRLDDAWARLLERPRARALWQYGAPGAVLVLAALLRLVGLGSPHELVFDETYYVKDAYTLSHLGYEAAWPEDANTAFNAGHPDIYLQSPAFVAHPPIGKWIIAAGLALFGAADPVGWRIAVALCGVLLVLLVMLVARRLFATAAGPSTLAAVVAGGLLAVDGNAIVMSRVALLDTPLALFALLGAYFVLLDRDGNRDRIAGWLGWRTSEGRSVAWGPSLWARPWLVAAGAAFGIASAIKWSGLYFLAVFAVYALVSEVLTRRRLGIPLWYSGSLLLQAPATFLLTVPLALAIYLASWTGWFVSDGGYYRHWIENDGGTPWNGLLAWVPYDLQNWWHYQASMYGYHVSENTPHAYQANPLTWLLLVRPTSMYWSANGNNAATILDLANPLIWWAGTAALVFVLVRLIRRPNPRDAFILVGIAAGYLPWLLYLGRTVFQFYTIAFEPFLVLALTAGVLAVLGSAGDPEPRRVAGIRTVLAFGAVCAALTLFFLPIWTGIEIPRWYMTMHFWFPSWV